MTAYSMLPSDKIEVIICGRLKAIRLDRNITQADLAAEAGLSSEQSGEWKRARFLPCPYIVSSFTESEN